MALMIGASGMGGLDPERDLIRDIEEDREVFPPTVLPE
jgi:hypothetical protein